MTVHTQGIEQEPLASEVDTAANVAEFDSPIQPAAPNQADLDPETDPILLASTSVSSEVLGALTGTMLSASPRSETLLNGDSFAILGKGIVNIGEIKFYKSTPNGVECLTCHTDVDEKYGAEKSGFFDMNASVETLENGGVEVTFADIRDSSKTISFVVKDSDSLKVSAYPQDDGSTVIKLTSSYELDQDGTVEINGEGVALTKGTDVKQELTFSIAPKKDGVAPKTAPASLEVSTNAPGWGGGVDYEKSTIEMKAPKRRE